MIITFPVLTMTRPMGGAIPPYEMANAMLRRGHSVHVMHVGLDDQIRSLGDMEWISFEDGIEHTFPGAQRTPDGHAPPIPREITMSAGEQRLAWLTDYLPAADFIAAYDDRIPLRHGLPFVLMQGYRPHAPELEDSAFRSPCPKVCVSRWLVEIGKQRGVPAEQLVYVPNGLKHEKYRLVSPIETRSPLVSAAYHDHPQKAPAETLAVLAEVKRRVPEAEAAVFSRIPPVHETAPWMNVVTNPPQEFIVNEIYNRSRVFLCASSYEGFGFPCIEAMACGAALVTTANGGSADYAIDGETALVCEPGDVTAMADCVERLLRDYELRVRLARRGHGLCARALRLGRERREARDVARRLRCRTGAIRAPMIITFPATAATRPNGGAKALYEFANATRRRGHSVQVVHIGWPEPIRSLRDLPWVSFEDGIEHIFPSAHPVPDAETLPPRDRVRLDTDGYRLSHLADFLPNSDFMAAFDDQLPLSHGLPFIFVQGYRVFVPAVEDAVFKAPCPKVCVSRWLVDVGKEKGVRDEELVYIPNGLEHEKYRLVLPVEDRPALLSFAYRRNPVTRPDDGLAVLAEVKRRLPEVEVTVFSPIPPSHEMAPWMTVLTNPPQEFIVNEIYNRSRVFLCASRYEGFGFPCIEAMACGAALVTTANGASADYAIDGETALVCEPGDVTAMADGVERLLRDDELRIRLARRGMDYVREHFDWDTSAMKLEAFLAEYAADPERYGRR